MRPKLCLLLVLILLLPLALQGVMTRGQIEEKIQQHWSRFKSGRGKFHYVIDDKSVALPNFIDYSGEWARCGDIWNIKYSGTSVWPNKRGEPERKENEGAFEYQGKLRVLVGKSPVNTYATIDTEVSENLNGFQFPGFFTASPQLTNILALFSLVDQGRRTLEIEEQSNDVVVLHFRSAEENLHIQVFLDGKLDYSVVYWLSEFSGGGSEGVVDISRDSKSGIYFPKSAHMTQYKTKADIDNVYVREFEFSDTDLNTVLNCEEIAIKFPSGTLISNSLTGVDYMNSAPMSLQQFLALKPADLKAPHASLPDAPALPGSKAPILFCVLGVIVLTGGLFLYFRR